MEVDLITHGASGHRGVGDAVLTAALARHGIRLVPGRGGRASALYTMLDDDVLEFMGAALSGLFLGRKTVGLFFRPGECFLRHRAKYRVKWMLFRALRRIPGTTIATILPYEIDGRLEQVSNTWIYDPQLWDMSFLTPGPSDANLAFKDEISSAAAGRHIVVALGSQGPEKGFPWLCDLWVRYPALRERYLFVAAGRVAPPCEEDAERFVGAGGCLLNRYMADAELAAAYEIADSVWSCYAPVYNQASGIFGRAVQFGVPTIVREGSYVAREAIALAHPAVELPLDGRVASQKLLEWRPVRPTPAETEKKVRRMRVYSIATLLRSLGAGAEMDAD